MCAQTAQTRPDSRPEDDSRAQARPRPHVVVVLGATGDLARRKLFPGLYHLRQLDLMPASVPHRLLGRTTADERVVHQTSPARSDVPRCGRAGRCGTSSSRGSGSCPPRGTRAASWRRRCRRGEGAGADAQSLFYLAVPPSATESVVRMLGTFGLSGPARSSWRSRSGRPAVGRRLNAVLHKVFDERQIYRIDHFLGKEAVQNILALRFANGLFEPVWNHQHVCYVQIDVPEEIDIQGRADFMESTGTLRDMISTHLFQLLGFVALDPPSRFDAESLHHEITKVFRAIRPPDPDRVVFGQYEGYRDEAGVDPAIDRRDVRRHGGLRRRLDLDRRAVLPAHRQGARRDQAHHHAGFPGAAAQGVPRRRRRHLQRTGTRAHRRPEDLHRCPGKVPGPRFRSAGAGCGST